MAGAVGIFLVAAGFSGPVKTGRRHPGSAQRLPDGIFFPTVKRNLPPASGTILGIIVPFSVQTKVLAISVADTIASTDSDTSNGAYMLKDVPPGNYALTYIPSDKQYRKSSIRAAVSDGQITIADTIWLIK
jgi:hypothetical protein